jgi:RPA family protein
MPDQYKRQPAVKIDIHSLRQGTFAENNDWQPNYISTEFGDLYRVNIIGLIVSKNSEHSSCRIDDGTATITVTFNFSDNYEVKKFQDIQEGQCVLIIALPRKYDDDMYLAPETIHHLDDVTWLKVRKEEIIQQRKNLFSVSNNNSTVNENRTTSLVEEKEEVSNIMINSVNTNEEDSTSDTEEVKDSYDIIYTVLKDFDKGDGVQVDVLASLLEEKNIKPGRAFITKLLEQGEIFEIMPGKVKLLE